MILTTVGEDEARARIRAWVALLAAGEYRAAADALAYPADAPMRYTPDALRDAIGSYRRAYREAAPELRSGLLPRVSDPGALEPDGERFDFYPHEAEPTALADYALPLDGEWSDLTATFFFFPEGGEHRLSLYDIRVM